MEPTPRSAFPSVQFGEVNSTQQNNNNNNIPSKYYYFAPLQLPHPPAEIKHPGLGMLQLPPPPPAAAVTNYPGLGMFLPPPPPPVAPNYPGFGMFLPPPAEIKCLGLGMLLLAARYVDTMPPMLDEEPMPHFFHVEEEEESGDDDDDSDYSGEEEGKGRGKKRRLCRITMNNSIVPYRKRAAAARKNGIVPYPKRASRLLNAQTKRGYFRGFVEIRIVNVRVIYRNQHRIASERPGPPLVCYRSSSGYYKPTEEQNVQYTLGGVHGLRKTKQSFAVSWNSVIMSQVLLDYMLMPGEESVSAEFEDPRDASAVNAALTALALSMEEEEEEEE